MSEFLSQDDSSELPQEHPVSIYIEENRLINKYMVCQP
jgi:hypothetical protein